MLPLWKILEKYDRVTTPPSERLTNDDNTPFTYPKYRDEPNADAHVYPKADTDIELWHKRIGHINLQKLKGMQLKGVVIGLPTFK